MRRAYVEPGELQGARPGERFELPADASHHLTRVLRLGAGAEVEIFDGAGALARGQLRPDGGVLIEEVGQATPPLPQVVVAQALVRGPKQEEIVRRGTELGAARFVFFPAERSQPGKLRVDRLERVAQQAARQAERAFVPELALAESFEALVDEARAFAGLAVMGVVGAEQSLSRALADDAARSGLLVVVGPEGGLSPEEQRRLREASVRGVGLGVHVLRTETAALAALAGAQAAWGYL